MNRNTTSEQGVTLVEMIIYLAIASVVLGTIATVYSAIVTLRNKNQAVMEVEQQGQQIVQNIGLAIRNAQSITAPATGVTAATASLQTFTAGTTPTLFAVTSGIATIKEGSAAAIPISGPNVVISNLSFRNLTRAGSDGVLRFSFTITAVNASGRSDRAAVRTFYSSATVRGIFP